MTEKNTSFAAHIIPRGEIVEFMYEGETKYGINLQNWLGNKMSPVIIVLEIQRFDLGKAGIIPFFQDGNSIVGVDLISFRTIDKNRVVSLLGKAPEKAIKAIDERIKAEYNEGYTYEKKLKIALFNFGDKDGTNEQGGYRPGVILKEEGDRFLIAPLSRQVQKCMNEEIQVLLHAGEGNILDSCLVLNEQQTLFINKSKKKITVIGEIPVERSQQIAKGRCKSIEILPLFEETTTAS